MATRPDSPRVFFLPFVGNGVFVITPGYGLVPQDWRITEAADCLAPTS